MRPWLQPYLASRAKALNSALPTRTLTCGCDWMLRAQLASRIREGRAGRNSGQRLVPLNEQGRSAQAFDLHISKTEGHDNVGSRAALLDGPP